MTGGVGGGERLDSWKAIAAYLGRDAGTVRRWERARGLPVHRVPGGKGTSVYAFTAEIDNWLKSAANDLAVDHTAVPVESTGSWKWPITLVAVALIGASAWLVGSRSP